MDCWFSDITVLHNHLNTMGYKTIHGIMPITYPRATAEAIESLKWLYLGSLRYEIALTL
jgi:muramoyltetrapeptide carboxypeptidase